MDKWNVGYGGGWGSFGKTKPDGTRMTQQDNPYPAGTDEYDGWERGYSDRFDDLRTDPLD